MAGLRTIRMTLNSVVFALLVLMTLTTESRAELYTYSFACVSNNGEVSAQTGEDQVFMDASADALTSAWVNFTFRNTGPEASSITDIYFYDLERGALSRFEPPAIITSSDGVKFDDPATPKDLPGYSQWDPVRVYSADSDSPITPNGVNHPNEWVNIRFNLDPSESFGDVVDDLAGGTLVVGVKVQGFANGYSESYLNNPPEVPPRVPLPGAVLLGGLGLGAAGWRLRGRKELV